RIRMPLLIVTAIIGACGKMKRTARRAGSARDGTTSDQPRPSSPSPCIQTTAASGFGAVSISIAGSSGSVMAFGAGSGVPFYETAPSTLDIHWLESCVHRPRGSLRSRCAITRRSELHRTTRLRDLIAAPEIVVMPGVHDALGARLAEAAG